MDLLATGSMMDAPSTATRSRPPSTACRKTVAVGPPIWIESETIAGGMLVLMRDQRDVGVDSVLGENAFVARDHRRGAVAGRGAGDLQLERVGMSRGDAEGRKRGDCRNANGPSAPPTAC